MRASILLSIAVPLLAAASASAQTSCPAVELKYDASEQLLESDDVAPGGLGTRTYAYDPLGQLASNGEEAVAA